MSSPPIFGAVVDDFRHSLLIVLTLVADVAFIPSRRDWGRKKSCALFSLQFLLVVSHCDCNYRWYQYYLFISINMHKLFRWYIPRGQYYYSSPCYAAGVARNASIINISASACTLVGWFHNKGAADVIDAK